MIAGSTMRAIYPRQCSSIGFYALLQVRHTELRITNLPVQAEDRVNSHIAELSKEGANHTIVLRRSDGAHSATGCLLRIKVRWEVAFAFPRIRDNAILGLHKSTTYGGGLQITLSSCDRPNPSSTDLLTTIGTVLSQPDRLPPSIFELSWQPKRRTSPDPQSSCRCICTQLTA